MTGPDVSTPAGLHAAILAHPDEAGYSLERDSELRLAYAQAIEADERPRADLIRLQIDVQVAGESASGRRAARIRDLLAHHGRGWAAVKDLVAAYRFYRGFVGHVTLSARDFLDRGERLYALDPITEVALRGGVRELADAIFASPLLARLRALDLAGQAIGDAGAARLSASPHLGSLVALNLDGNRLTVGGLRALADSRALPRLQLASFAGNLDDVSPVGEGGELPPLGQQLEEERSGRIAWLHSGGDWVAFEREAASLIRKPA